MVTEGKKLLNLNLQKMILIVEEILKENELKDETKEDCDLTKIHKFPVCFRDSKKSITDVSQRSIVDNKEVFLGLVFT